VSAVWGQGSTVWDSTSQQGWAGEVMRPTSTLGRLLLLQQVRHYASNCLQRAGMMPSVAWLWRQVILAAEQLLVAGC
jgi:hypothetical protein